MLGAIVMIVGGGFLIRSAFVSFGQRKTALGIMFIVCGFALLGATFYLIAGTIES